MWGSKAATWTDKPVRNGSMKWHLVDEDSLEERSIEIGWGEHKRSVPRTFGALMCGGRKHDWMYYNNYINKYIDNRFALVLIETINMSQSNVCVYCKKFRMKQLGIPDKVIG